jgi:hypothetical protein
MQLFYQNFTSSYIENTNTYSYFIYNVFKTCTFYDITYIFIYILL